MIPIISHMNRLLYVFKINLQRYFVFYHIKIIICSSIVRHAKKETSPFGVNAGFLTLSRFRFQMLIQAEKSLTMSFSIEINVSVPSFASLIS